MTKALDIKPVLKDVDKSKAKQIEATFAPMVAMLKDFEGAYSEVMKEDQSPEKSKKAKRLRLDIAKIRVAADKVRKEQKDEYLRAGNAIQGVYNILKFAVQDKEEALRDIELYYDRIEAEKKEALAQDRISQLSAFGVQGGHLELGDMDEAVWDSFISSAEVTYNAKKEAEKMAEAAKAETAEKMRALEEENAKLRAEKTPPAIGVAPVPQDSFSLAETQDRITDADTFDRWSAALSDKLVTLATSRGRALTLSVIRLLDTSAKELRP